MQKPLEISFRNMDWSESVAEKVKEKFQKLEHMSDQIVSAHIIIDAPHRSGTKGNHFKVGIEIGVPNQTLVVSHENDGKSAHEDVYVAMRDSFNAIGKQLEAYTDKRRNRVKSHSKPSVDLDE